jgi:hypothetical protein
MDSRTVLWGVDIQGAANKYNTSMKLHTQVHNFLLGAWKKKKKPNIIQVVKFFNVDTRNIQLQE